MFVAFLLSLMTYLCNKTMLKSYFYSVTRLKGCTPVTRYMGIPGNPKWSIATSNGITSPRPRFWLEKCDWFSDDPFFTANGGQACALTVLQFPLWTTGIQTRTYDLGYMWDHYLYLCQKSFLSLISCNDFHSIHMTILARLIVKNAILCENRRNGCCWESVRRNAPSRRTQIYRYFLSNGT